jgi:hypothetical protein
MDCGDDTIESQNDTMVAAEAAYIGCCVLTNDQHFLYLKQDKYEFYEAIDEASDKKNTAQTILDTAKSKLEKAQKNPHSKASTIARLTQDVETAQQQYNQAYRALVYAKNAIIKPSRALAIGKINGSMDLSQEHDGMSTTPRPFSFKHFIYILEHQPNYIFSKPVHPIIKVSSLTSESSNNKNDSNELGNM